MFNFLTQNLATITVGIAVATIFVLAVVKTVRDNKKGSCSCGCQNCTLKDNCKK